MGLPTTNTQPDSFSATAKELLEEHARFYANSKIDNGDRINTPAALRAITEAHKKALNKQAIKIMIKDYEEYRKTLPIEKKYS